MRAVALLTSLSLVACFPHDPHARSITEYAEGGAVILGVGILALAGTGADCDANNQAIAMPDSSCHTKATVLSDIGLALLIGGLVGFIGTVSTAEDDKPPTSVLTPEKKEPLPTPKLPMPVAAPAPTPAPDPAATPGN